MHLRSLTLQALGPFAEQFTIDFAALGAGGLFLLDGPTGAGKSTVIDAIVFALYGKVAGEHASDDRLRSSFATADLETFVDLVFEVPAGVFRVRRTPAYQRAKRRGSGTTTAQATVRLWRLPAEFAAEDLDAVGTPMSNRLDEAGAEIVRLVGLDRGQFAQTVVLPQGEFARFVHAAPEERRGLLQRIFGTQVYERLADRLVELRGEGNRTIEAARAGLVAAGAGLAGAARLPAQAPEQAPAQVLVAPGESAVTVGAGSPPEPAEASAELSATRLRDRLGELAPAGLRAAGGLVERVRDLVDPVARERAAVAATTTEAADQAATRWDRAVAELRRLERLDGLVRARERLHAEQRELAEQEPAHRARAAALARARVAREVAPLITGLQAATTAEQLAAAAFSTAWDATPEQVREPLIGMLDDTGRGDPEAAGRHLTDRHQDAVALAATLDRVVRVEAGLTADRAAVDELAEAVAAVQVELAGHRAWLADRPTEREQLVARLDATRARAAELGAARSAALDAAALLAAVRELTLVEAERAAAVGELTAQRARALALVDVERQLRASRLAGLAGELAVGLLPGEPCPVCGAPEHPRPAQLAADHVDAAAVAAAEQRRQGAEREVESSALAVERLTERSRVLTERVGAHDEPAAAELLARARALEQDCAAAVDRGAALTAELAGFDAVTADREQQRAASDVLRAGLQTRLEAQRAALEAATAEVVGARDGYPSAAARRDATLAAAEATAALVGSLAGLREARHALELRSTQVTAELAARGLGAVQDAQDAMLDQAAFAAAVTATDGYTAAVTRVQLQLADPDLELVAHLPDDADLALPAARDLELAQRAEATAARTAAGVAAEVATATESAVAAVLSSAALLAAAIERHAPVVRLAGLATGQGADNAGNLSLATYVLRRRFEDVVAAANARLTTMSDGRYTVVASDQREDVRARATGLAMRVEDHWTGARRDPRTLSGGETFYVALCLALGLADVVSAEAGGVELGTLFVDEGFGSLDPHVLEQVVAELGRLRAGGRSVGVVSHVESLKQAIADRIEVRPTPAGPSTLTVRAG